MEIVKTRPMVSVWMVTYNHEKFIRQSLESVIKQKTDFDFEIIIGEDCSTDGTRLIIQEFERKYPGIVKPIYHDTNVGAYRNAYEYCYPKLKGDYVACLEADDYWTDENKLQIQVDALEADRSAVLCFTRVENLIDGEGRFEENWSTAYNVKKKYSLTDILKTFNIVTCTILFRNVYPVLPYDPLNFPTGDVSLCAFLLLKGDAIYINKLTSVYRLHQSGIYSTHDLENKNLVFVKIFEEFLKQPKFKSYQPLIKVLLADRAYQALCFEIKKNNPDQATLEKYYQLTIAYFSFNNVYFPLKAFLRKNLFRLTGKPFGRKL